MVKSQTILEREVLTAAKGGDEGALSQLVQTYQYRVFNYVARLVPQAADAEDVTQEVLLEMIKSLETFREEASLATWIFRITTTKIADFFRKRAKHQAVPLDGQTSPAETPSLEIPDQTPTPLGRFEQREREQLVEGAFQTLPDLYRSVLLLRVQEGCSYQQIAEVLGCAVGTVKSRMHNGMVLMGQALTRIVHEGR